MRRLLTLCCCFLLAACYSGGKRGGEEALTVYDLGLPAFATSAVQLRRDLALEVRTPLWMDSMGIEYRLLYAEPARLLNYTRARWAGPPSQLIQRRLARQLGLMPAGQGAARCVLRVDIDVFAQVFDDPGTSRGRLQGQAQLFGSNRSLLATYGFKIEKPAPSADSRGGVAALTAAVDQLAGDLAAWEKSAAGADKGAACPV